MIETIPNEYGDMEIEVQEAVGFICLGGPSKAQLTVAYTPDKLLLELISFHNWCISAFTKTEPQPLESIVCTVFKTLNELLTPVYLEVIGKSIVAGVHGPMKVSKSS